MAYYLAVIENKHNHKLYFQVKCDIPTVNEKATLLEGNLENREQLFVRNRTFVGLVSDKVGICEPNFNENPCLIG